MVAVNIFLVILLILATAFFVAIEFAIVKLRPSRINQLIEEGNHKAQSVQEVISNLDEYLSACQLGITITALGLGWLGEPTVGRLLHPVLEYFHLPDQVITVLSFVIAFSLVTFLHVVLGELAPKTVAIQKAEEISLLLARPIIWFYKLMYPFIWLLNGSARLLIRLFGLKRVKENEEAHSEEELRILLTESYRRGEINQTEYGYVSRIFDFDNLQAKEIMVPRIDMSCLYMDRSLEENLHKIKEQPYSRFPVAKEHKDQIVGMLHTKEFFLGYMDHPNLDLAEWIRPIFTMPASTPVKTLLKEMQRQGVQLALLVDEYGGTSGMITIEDMLEEIVGDIRDEFDEGERAEFEILSEANVLVDGKVPLSVIRDHFDVKLESDGFDTIGGWLYGHQPRLQEGEEWEYEGLTFIIRKKEKHRVRKIEIIRSSDAQKEQ